MVSDFGCDEKNDKLLDNPKRKREHSVSNALSTCDQDPTGSTKQYQALPFLSTDGFWSHVDKAEDPEYSLFLLGLFKSS